MKMTMTKVDNVFGFHKSYIVIVVFVRHGGYFRMCMTWLVSWLLRLFFLVQFVIKLW